MVDNIANYFIKCYESLRSWKNFFIACTVVIQAIVFLLIIHSRSQRIIPPNRIREGYSIVTCHIAVWSILVLELPIIGSLLYLFFSIFPYRKWVKDNKAKLYPFEVYLRKYQLGALLCTGGIIKLIDLICNIDGTMYEFSIAIICWLALIIMDYYRTYHRQMRFVGFNTQKQDYCYEGILGKTVYVSSIDNEFNDIESARNIADLYFSPVPMLKDELNVDDVVDIDKNIRDCRFDVSNNTAVWKMGLNKVQYYEVNEDEDAFIEKTGFSVIPRFRYFISRCVVLLFIVFACYTPVITNCGLGILNIIKNTFGGEL